MTNESVYCLLTYRENIFAGTKDSGIYQSTNSGINWVKINQGFNGNPIIFTLMIANEYIYAGTYRYSVWRRRLDELLK